MQHQTALSTSKIVHSDISHDWRNIRTRFGYNMLGAMPLLKIEKKNWGGREDDKHMNGVD